MRDMRDMREIDVRGTCGGTTRDNLTRDETVSYACDRQQDREMANGIPGDTRTARE